MPNEPDTKFETHALTLGAVANYANQLRDMAAESIVSGNAVDKVSFWQCTGEVRVGYPYSFLVDFKTGNACYGGGNTPYEAFAKTCADIERHFKNVIANRHDFGLTVGILQQQAGGIG
jgi:hypothetical protein